MDFHLTSNPLETPLSFLSVRALPAALAVMLVTACATASTATSIPDQETPAAQTERVTRPERPAGSAGATQSEKDARTAAQQKIDSRLLYEIYRKRGQAAEKNVPPGPTGVRLDGSDRALVDIRASVTPALIALVKKSGAAIVSSSTRYHSIIARVPLLQLERLAGDPAVRAISPAAEATTVR
jgi:hypothetical protein